jgi:starch synthase
MSAKKRILFIANEMSPYLELTEFAETVNKLAVKANNQEWEVRCIMPRFGVINERRHKLHEVVRLSGINISVDNDDIPLQIKVASLPSSRLQVYFLDNEELFKRKTLLHDENDAWFEDNDLRTVFYCKAALETVKKFGWPPDVIHCSGWMTGLIPYYLKTAYRREPVFAHSKILYTIGDITHSETLGDNFQHLANISPLINVNDLNIFGKGDNKSMFKGGASFADCISFGTAEPDEELKKEFNKVKGKSVIHFDETGDLTDYLQLYNELADH